MMDPGKKNSIDERRIEASDSIVAAMRRMDAIDRKLLLVFDGDRFAGLISIGDIQRAIIADKPLHTALRDVMRSQVTMASITDGFDQIRQLMIRYRAECMPVLDGDGNLADVVFWEDIYPVGQAPARRSLDLPVVIMAGGKGLRMRPFTSVLPKPLLPVGDRTIIEHIMAGFSELGCNRFHISVNYKAGLIRYYLGTLDEGSFEIEYFQEEKPLGTAGSLYLLKDRISTTFFVTNCDILVDEDYGAILDYHREQANELTLVAALKHLRIPYGTIESASGGQLTALHEKPELTFRVNTGLYILEPHLLGEIEPDVFLNITDLIEKVKQRGGRVGVFPVSEKSWVDVGEWDQYILMSRRGMGSI